MEVTDIAKIVRKKIRFWILQTKPLKSRTCKECEKNVTILQIKTHKVKLVKNMKKKTFLILQMKTHIRDNHAEY